MILHRVLVGTLVLLVGCESPPVAKEELLAFLADGATARAQVHERLGEPSRRYEQSNLESYRVGRRELGWFVHPGHDGWTEARYSLVLEFDEQGLLKRHALVDVRP